MARQAIANSKTAAAKNPVHMTSPRNSIDGPNSSCLALIGSPRGPFTFTAAQIGQVFGVALDGDLPPNIYVAATSAYGLPIVAPGADGQLRHIKSGAPKAVFMPGLWRPQGGPGSIWKVEGATGRVSLFANVSLVGRANSGPALGGLAYDPGSKSLFVADRESGLIYRLTIDGRILDHYDHGVTGRQAQGLPSVPWNSQQPMDITSPHFDSTDPATWNYAAPERRVFGLAVFQHRLYYAVADGLQIWSVGLNADGSFGGDAVIELEVPPSIGPTEVSKIAFDEQARMFLAERPAQTGTFDFEVLAVPAIGRVLRYAQIGRTPDGHRIWQEAPDEYGIGFPRDFRNDNGGVAIGYNYEHNGEFILSSCGGFMWTTGEDLRDSSDVALATRLGQSGPLHVTGLQGNGTWRVERNSEAPLESCSNSNCPSGQAAIGPSNFCCNSSQVYTNPTGAQACCTGQVVNGQCQPSTPPITSDCPTGYVSVGSSCCLASQLTSTGACCPAGQTPSGTQCVPYIPIRLPPPLCCPAGQIPTAGSKSCCAIANVTTTGVCCSQPVDPNNRTYCPAQIQLVPACAVGYTKMPDGSCCNNRFVSADGMSCNVGGRPCAPGEFRELSGACVPIPPNACPPGEVRSREGGCIAVPSGPVPLGPCPPGQFRNGSGRCLEIPSAACPPDEVRNRSGECAPVEVPACPPGEVRSRRGVCVRVEPRPPVVAPRPPRRPIGLPPPPPRFGPRLPFPRPNSPILRSPPGQSPFGREQ